MLGAFLLSPPATAVGSGNDLALAGRSPRRRATSSLCTNHPRSPVRRLFSPRPRPPAPPPGSFLAGPSRDPLGGLRDAARRHPLACWSAVAVALFATGALEPSSGQSVPSGSPITATTTAPAAPGLAARLGGDESAVAIATDARMPPLVAGQRVDLYAPAAGLTPSLVPAGETDETGETDARRLTTGASVLEADERRIVVAVHRDDVPAVSAALLDGHVLVALTAG